MRMMNANANGGKGFSIDMHTQTHIHLTMGGTMGELRVQWQKMLGTEQVQHQQIIKKLEVKVLLQQHYAITANC